VPKALQILAQKTFLTSTGAILSPQDAHFGAYILQQTNKQSQITELFKTKFI